MPATKVPSVEELCQRGIDMLAGRDVSAVRIDAHHRLVRALRDAGRLEQSIDAALSLTAITSSDSLAHTALSISLRHAGHVPQAEAAAARARVPEWKTQLRSAEEEPPPDNNQPAKEPPGRHPPAQEPPSEDPPKEEPPAKELPMQDPRARDDRS